MRRSQLESLEPRQLLASDLIISEFMASNTKTLADKDGEFGDWIEIRNVTGADINLAGWALTNASGNLAKWKFPSQVLNHNEYLVVFASNKDLAVAGQELHTNFKLSAAGEYLALVTPGGVIATQFSPKYDVQTADVSFGEFGGLYYSMKTPTPGLPNLLTAQDNTRPPEFSVQGKTFVDSFEVALSVTNADPDMVIRYTIDNKDPTEASPVYSAPLSITKTTWVRARVFQPGRQPSAIVSQLYSKLDVGLKDFKSNLPVFVLTSFSGAVGDGAYANAYAQLFEPDSDALNPLLGTPDFSFRAGMKVRGSSSTQFPKKQWSFETHTETNDNLDLPLLGMGSEHDWVLSAPYTDKTLLRDRFTYETSNNMGQYAPNTRLVEVFLDTNGNMVQGLTGNNAEYMGVYVLEEKIKRDANRVDVAPITKQDNAGDAVTGGYIFKIDRLDPGDSGFRTKAGKASDGRNYPAQPLAWVEPKEKDVTAAQKAYVIGYFNAFIDALMSKDFADPVLGYQQYIDVDTFIDYHILNEFTKNIDGFRLSTFLYKDRNGKLKYGPAWDHNLSTGNANYNDGWLATGWYYNLLSGTDYAWWPRLFQDPNFMQRYVDRYAQLRQGALAESQVLGQIDRDVRDLGEAEKRDHQRWPILGIYVWPNWFIGKTYAEEINFMKQWIRDRLKWMDATLGVEPVFNQHGGLIAPGFGLTMAPATGSSSVYYTLDGTDPRLSGGGISPNAVKYTGVVTLNQATHVIARSKIGSGWGAPRDVVFSTAVPPLRVSEIMYHPADPPAGSQFVADDFEFLELQNVGSLPLNVKNFHLTKGVDFTFPDVSLAPGERAIVVRNAAAFATRYPGVAPLGQYVGLLDNKSGEAIQLVDSLGAVIQEFNYDVGWYPLTDGEGFSLVVIDPTAALPTWNERSSWRPSAAMGGNPLAGDSGVAPGSIVINELMSRTAQPQGDWLELKNLTTASIDLGGWFLSDDALNLKKYRIPAGTSIAANGLLTFNQTDHFGKAGDPNALVPFSFSPLGGSVYLTQADGAGNLGAYREDRNFGGSAAETSFVRYIKSTGGTDFVQNSEATPGAENTGTPRMAKVVLEEVMYHGLFTDAYVELINRTNDPVPLFDPANPAITWRIGGGIQLTIPADTTIAPNGRVLLSPIDPALFRKRYGVPASVPVLGPYTGALNNDGDSVEILEPGVPLGDGSVPYITTDRVNYDDQAPWPVEADGGGRSLFRKDFAAYGNDVANWQLGDTGKAPGRDAGPRFISVDDVSLNEGAAGKSNMVFTVSLSQTSGFTITLNWATSNGTGSSPADYSAATGTITLLPDSLSAKVTVQITGDGTYEPDETFKVTLSSPLNATIDKAIGTGTILNDDPVPLISIADVNVAEGNTGLAYADFALTLSNTSSLPVTVPYAALPGTAQANSDYFPASGVVTFTPGTVSAKIRIVLATDVSYEPDETLSMILSPPTNGVLARDTAVATIINDDPAPVLTVADVSVNETDAGTVDAVFTVVATGATSAVGTVVYSTSSGTAAAGRDFESASGTLTFQGAVTSQKVTIKVKGDAVAEINETYALNLANAVNLTLPAAPAIGTIVDNGDAVPELVISDLTVTEGNSGTSDAVLTISLSKAAAQDVTLNFATASGSAQTPGDYLAALGPLTIAANSTATTITIPIVGDAASEGDESFAVSLSNAVGASIGVGTANVTIIDNDVLPTPSVSNTDDSGPGSLRQAILDINSGNFAPKIQFNFAAPGAHEFALSTPLPGLTVPVVFDVPEGHEIKIGTLSANSLGSFVGLSKLGQGGLTLGGALATSGPASFSVRAGLVSLLSDLGENVAVDTRGGKVDFHGSQHLASLDIDGAGTGGSLVRLMPGGNKMIVAKSLAIDAADGGALDLADNWLVLKPDAAAKAAMLADLFDRIKMTRATGWVGPGLGSSTAAADAKQLTGLGIIGNDKPNGAPFYSSFGGVPVDANAILARYTYNGDSNLNGVVDGTDYGFIDNGYNVGLAGWRNGDYNYDGLVNGTDYAIIDNSYNLQGAPLAAAPPAQQAVDALLGIGPIGLAAAPPETARSAALAANSADSVAAAAPWDDDASVPPPPAAKPASQLELSEPAAEVDEELLDLLSGLE